MQERTGGQRAARLLLRALLLAGAAVVAVLIGASTAQADDADAAAEAPAATGSAAAPGQTAHEAPAAPAAGPAHRLAAVTGRVNDVAATVHRSTQRVVASTTRTVREVGRQAPVAEPVVEPATEAVATVVDRTTGRLDTRVTEVTKAAQALVDGAVTEATDVADDVLATDGGAPEADVESSPLEEPAVSSDDTDRRTDGGHGAAPTPAVVGPAHETARAAQAVRPDSSPDSPPLDAILEFGAFSGAPSTGSGAAGGPSSTGTLPAGLRAPADVSAGVVTHADEERLFALPFTPGWSPD